MVFVFFIIKRGWPFLLSLQHLYNRILIPILNPGLTKALNIGVALSSVILFLHCKLNKKVPFVFNSWPHFECTTVQGVRAGSCPGCRGPSQRSWCLSLNRRCCARPPPGFSPVFACGWHWDEPAGPGSQNDHAFHQMGPGSDGEG